MESPIESESYSITQLMSLVIGSSSIEISAGETNFTIINRPINIIYISANAAETITSIPTFGDGYIVFIIAEDNNITIQSNAEISLNSLPTGTALNMKQYDVLVLISKDNTYQELFRTEKN